MPLFGGHKHDKKQNTLHKDEQMATATGANGGPNNNSMAGGRAYAADSNDASAGGRGHHHQGMHDRQHGYPISNDYGNPGMNNQSGMGGPGYDRYNDYGGNQGNIPPSSNLNASGGAGHSTAGKVEKALGAAVGSNALKAKGMQKEMEANALKTQSSELAEAERLEREALLRRERAVAHGAHPENRHLGGVDGQNTLN
ncbi:MAG: hypothetical protein NXY57DRAFT_997407 [Lentinula lateritia]|uniref:Uncharacterized protein n=1 Tax=Lentinula lateritia TaxID=40482 RepID=A0ABQ8V537_9AGAR|nr:MAG: hypothetical protein NXY57DRAFT_997407 [Lentinula lateritia]KAJ4474768.1 hypothetical protein C8R41DRAFT_923782 [Lentinula lateritia]